MRVVFVGSSSMGPRFIMGLLKRHGHQCYGIYQGVNNLLGEQPAAGFEEPISLDDLLSLEPGIVGFSACSYEIAQHLEMASLVKQANNEILVVFGGVHPTILPESVISHKAVDVVCIGEGEYPLLDLCDALENQKDIANIPSLWVKQNGSIYRNATRERPHNLDELPMDREGLPYMGIFSGRGCVGQCSFCNSPTIKAVSRGKYFRKRSIDDVLDEISQIYDGMPELLNPRRLDKVARLMPVPDHFARKVVHKGAMTVVKSRVLRNSLVWLLRWLSIDLREPIRFKDDTFLADKTWFMKFAPAFRERFPDLRYICQARANEIDDKVAQMLGETGCYLVSLGIECGNEEYRNKVLKKRVTNAHIIHAVELLRRHKVKVMGQWIIGYPGETVELALESLLFHMQVGDIPQVHIAVPFPKTAMHDQAVEMGFISKDYVPNTTIYDDFMFHKGHERMLMHVIYKLFPIASMPVDPDFKDIQHGERVASYRDGIKIGELLERAISGRPGSS